MTCLHLEETSALFDGRTADRTHADACGECRAFLDDAAQLRDALRDVTFAPTFAAEPRRRILPILVPAALVLCLALFLFFRSGVPADDGPFAGLDGGGRAAIAVKDLR